MNVRHPAAVFFDLDGTLVDTAPDFFRVINQLLVSEGREPMRLEDVRVGVSGGSKTLIGTAFGLPEDDPTFEPLRQRLLDLYLAGVADESLLFPGFDHLLRRLDAAGIRWGVVTNKPRRFSSPLLEHLGLTPRLAALVCADDLPRTKPHPDPLFLAARTAQVEPSGSWYVGDHLRDIQAGRAAGMTTVAAAYGYLEADADPGDWLADHRIDCVGDLERLIFDHRGSA